MATNSAINVYAPTSTNKHTVATAACTTQSIGAVARVWMKSTVDARIRFGSATNTTVTAGDIYLTGGLDYVFDIAGLGAAAVSGLSSAGRDTYFSTMLVGSTTGTLYWAKAG